MLPWNRPPRARGLLLHALGVLSLAVVVSCTTVASGSAPSSGLVAGGSAPASAPTPGATSSPPAAVTPTTAPVPTPSASPIPSAVPAWTALPVESLTPVVLDRKATRTVKRILDNQVNKQGIAGLQVAVRTPDGRTWSTAAGVAEYGPDRPLREHTQMAIASVTKTFVAALILQLAEEGKIDLDATFGSYFRDAPRKDTVTIRQLLSHRSGIYNIWANPRYRKITEAWWKRPNASGLKSRSHRWTYEEMMDLVKSGLFKPGEDYSYSNTNYVILGKVAEAVEGQPLAAQLRRRFFEPLGLDDTIYQPAQKPRADAAHGHWAWGSGHLDHTRDADYIPFLAAVTVADAAGAMASTAADLARWSGALYGGEVLEPEMLEQMTTFLQPGLYGLGTDVAVFAGHVAYGHRGGIRGYESSMWYFPESGVSIVLLSNQGNWVTDAPMERIVKAVLGEA